MIHQRTAATPLTRCLTPGVHSKLSAWDKILDRALERPTEYLSTLIPADFNAIVDAANPHEDPEQAFQELEQLLRNCLAYEERLDRGGLSLQAAEPPELPADLREWLQRDLVPAFAHACADLLNRNDGSHARRAFERRSLQETVANARKILDNTEELLEKYALKLVRIQPPAYDDARELDILLAKNRTIPLVGRRKDLDELHAWLLSPEKVSFRVLTGPAGAGKTRLAYQFLEDLEELRNDGKSLWDAGFLRGAGLKKLDERHWKLPTVAIADYAAASASILREWLAYLADQEPEQKLRLLLLERVAQKDSGWLSLVLTPTGPQLETLMNPDEPVRVTRLAEDDHESRRAILEGTLRKLGSTAVLPAHGQNPDFDHRLRDPRWQDPLYLMMAALVGAKEKGVFWALSLSRTDLAEHVAKREIAGIKGFLPAGAPKSAGDFLVRLAGIVTACAGERLTHDDLTDIAAEEAAAMQAPFPAPPDAATLIAEALARQVEDQGTSSNAAPSTKTITAPIEPDIVGEAVLLQAFAGRKGAEALVRAARRWNRRHASSVMSSRKRRV